MRQIRALASLLPRSARLSGELNSVAILYLPQPTHVMPGLVPGIHARKPSRTSIVVCNGAAWMAGTSPAMTPKGSEQTNYSSDFATFHFPRTVMRRREKGLPLHEFSEGFFEVGMPARQSRAIFDDVLGRPKNAALVHGAGDVIVGA